MTCKFWRAAAAALLVMWTIGVFAQDRGADPQSPTITVTGHRVVVTGTLAPPMSSGAGTGRANDPNFKSSVQRPRVAAIKMIAADCTRQRAKIAPKAGFRNLLHPLRLRP